MGDPTPAIGLRLECAGALALAEPSHALADRHRQGRAPAVIVGGLTAFGVVFIAEFGDKSQLVCIALAARHPHRAVFLGVAAAFAILNALAVLLGAGLAQWIPRPALAGAAALLFAIFGVLAIVSRNREESSDRDGDGDGDGDPADPPDTATPERQGPDDALHRSALLTAFLLIFVAEFGDKTQLAVAGLAGTLPPLPVWLGATLAHLTTSALGVIVGSRLLQHLSLRHLRLAGGVVFLVVAAFAFLRFLGHLGVLGDL